MNPTPYPPDEGPLFRCTLRGPGNTGCGWIGFPVASDRCVVQAVDGPHRYEPANFNGCSFQPLLGYAERSCPRIQPSEFMAMGCHAWFVDGSPTVIFAYKHTATRNYLHIDAIGYSAWTVGPRPEPRPAVRAIRHALGMHHYHGDGCLSGSRVVTLGRRRKAG